MGAGLGAANPADGAEAAVEQSGGSVLVEAGPGGRPSLFDAPRAVVTAHEASEVPGALAWLEEARASGLWIAGFAAYELGLALEPKLAPLLDDVPGEGPLLAFGVFDAPRDLPEPTQEPAAVLSAEPLWDRTAYGIRFHQIKAMIARGDLYQVNLTMPMALRFEGSGAALWQVLRRFQPVGHAAHLAIGGTEILSCSPELFFRMDAAGRIEVAPMKGTAPRGSETAEDDALRDALSRDEKNRAENIMIVDLMRNDLSRLSRVGSVKVPALCEVERYNTVHQMVSRIEARLEGHVPLPQLMEALFPCGSITGAPKIAAMQAIHDLERWRRGAYCGAIGWAAPDGSADFSVAIRTLTVTAPGEALMGVGGGIVHDSDCDAEYEEALWKSRFVTGLIPRSA